MKNLKRILKFAGRMLTMYSLVISLVAMSIFVSAVSTLGGSQAWAGQKQEKVTALFKQTSMVLGMMVVYNSVKTNEFFGYCKGGAAGYCALGAMTALQVAIILAGKNDEPPPTETTPPECPGCGATDSNDKLTTTPNGLNDKFKKTISDMKTKGYTIAKDNKSFTTPDGKTHGVGALASGEAMLKEGLIGPEDVALVNKEMNDMNSKMKAALNNAGGAGGGGYTAPTKSDFKYDTTDPYAALYGQKPGDPKTKGLTRTLASGESIGSQTDNIFEMVSRCYERKNSQKIFYQPQGH